MRILDADLQMVLIKLSKEEIDKVEKEIANKSFSLGREVNPFYTTDDVREAVTKAVGHDLANIIDDDKAIESIKDENEKNFTSMLREEITPNGKKTPVRKISKFEIESLIDRAKIMNKGQAYANFLAGLSYDELKKVDPITSAMKATTGDERYTIDPKYGINAFDKNKISDIMKAKAELKKYVDNIPSREFNKQKSIFEKMKNQPFEHYERTGDEVIATLNTLFGKDNSVERIRMQNGICMVDIYEAFEEKEKNIESKANNGFFAKLKKLFSSFRKGKKIEALPEGRDLKNSKRDEFLSATKISPENAKYTITETKRDNKDNDKSDDYIK